MSPQTRSVSMLLATMVIWGGTFVVTKEAIRELQPLSLAFVRVAIGALVLFPAALLRWQHLQSMTIPWRAVFVLGLVGVAFYYVAFNAALMYTTASQGALVQSSIPAVTALVAALWLGERGGIARWLGIALSVLGILIVFGDSAQAGGERTLLGNLLMFLTVIAWGVYTSLAKRVAHLDPIVVTACIISIGALLLLPMAVVEVAMSGLPELSLKGWAAVVFLGALASGAAYGLYNAALRFVDASEAGVYTNLIPIVGVVTGVLVLEEPLSLQVIAGGAVVAVGVWVTHRASARRSQG